MQSSLSSLQKVTAALAAQQGPQLYVADAARLGFSSSGQIPHSLETDLGNGRRLRFRGMDSDGVATYEQHRVPGIQQTTPVLLRVLNADPERAKAEKASSAQSMRMPAGMKVQTETCPVCRTGHSGPLCPEQAKEAAAAQVRLSDVEISTSQFEFVHGHAPRGRASWAFYFADAAQEPWWAPSNLLYSEACRKARHEAQRRGVSRVIVAT